MRCTVTSSTVFRQAAEMRPDRRKTRKRGLRHSHSRSAKRSDLRARERAFYASIEKFRGLFAMSRRVRVDNDTQQLVVVEN